ncbi:MAG: glycosyltransferase [Candidatus Altiarchaeota archaeon]|nr:glycosyltransferase [Candidatus Altiarchaeota archaeon]
MKIGIFTDTYFPQINGVTFTIKAWKDRLKETHDVSIYYPDGKYKPEHDEFPFKSMEFKFYKGYKVAFPVDVSRKAKDLDIVHIHGLFSMALAGLYVSKRYRLPRILTYHTPADQYISYMTKNKTLQSSLMKLYNLWERKLLNSCDFVTCPSKPIREMLLKKGVNDVTVLSNGIDLEFFKPANPEPFRKKFGIKAGKVIGFCGRFGYEKHLEDLIGIADEFDGEILIAGVGPAEEHFKKLGKGKKNVKFIGFLTREELLEFYSCLDVFVFPSTAETQGLVALEAMACGTPVVGADAMALKDTIQEGVNGYRYNQGDLKKLMQLIDKAYKNKDELAKNGLETVKEHSLHNTVEKLNEIYEKLAGL